MSKPKQPESVEFGYEADVLIDDSPKRPLSYSARRIWLGDKLVIDNSDGSLAHHEDSDFAPLGLEAMSTWVLIFWYVVAVLFFLAIPSIVAWFYF